MNGTDIHQHLWPEQLIAALSWRREGPLVRRAAVVRSVGVDQLVYGSDRPVVDARPGASANVERLLHGSRRTAVAA